MSHTDVEQANILTDARLIRPLIAKLASKDGLTRIRARAALTGLGSAATAALVLALLDSRVQVRWESAKTLAEIADPAAALALVRALGDEDFGVRWLAAEGLVKLGRAGLVPLLEQLARRLVSEPFREAAHHVIHAQVEGSYGEALRPVLEALGGFAAKESVPFAAQQALTALEG
jgi:HEAT repeat protein